jgi:hypothetical protein
MNIDGCYRVINLQGVIARGCRISEDKQVLLISGGESLDPNAVVGKYHAGTVSCSYIHIYYFIY